MRILFFSMHDDPMLGARVGSCDCFRQRREERLGEIVRSSLSLSAEEICQKIADHLQTFTTGTPQWDDITLAVVKIKPEFSESVTTEPAMSEFLNV